MFVSPDGQAHLGGGVGVLYLQGIINRPPPPIVYWSGLQWRGSPSCGANVNKRFNFVNVVVLGAMIFVVGGDNSSNYMHARLCKYKLHHQKLMQTMLRLIWSNWHVPPLFIISREVVLRNNRFKVCPYKENKNPIRYCKSCS